MEDFTNILIKLAATLLCYGVFALTQKAREYLKDKKEAEKLDKFLDELVAAAEQMYYGEDEDGSGRRGYVQDMLMEAGYELTEIVRAKIEAKVLNVNLAKKGVTQGE